MAFCYERRARSRPGRSAGTLNDIQTPEEVEARRPLVEARTTVFSFTSTIPGRIASDVAHSRFSRDPGKYIARHQTDSGLPILCTSRRLVTGASFGGNGKGGISSGSSSRSRSAADFDWRRTFAP